MATIICMDGLGGYPEVTFGGLQKSLELAGHWVILADVRGVITHENRVQRVLEAFQHARLFRRAAEKSGDKIFLLGQSAGGSAVRIAASRLGECKDLAGIILLSPAMPRSVWFMTSELARIMARKIFSLLFSDVIHTTELEYGKLIEPVANVDQRIQAIARRQPIPGPESRKLAFYPDSLSRFECPAFMIYGDQDKWISPNAHRKFCMLLKGKCPSVSYMEVQGAGHLTLFSCIAEEVYMMIKGWIKNNERS